MNRNATGRIAPVALLLCTIVKQSPGIHFRGLARAANVSSTGQLRHHIDRLGRRGALIEVVDGRFKRFFVPGDHDAERRQRLARFARRVPLLIGRILLDRPLSRTALRRTLGCADSTLGYHLGRMVSLGDVRREVTRNSAVYALADPTFVRELLLRNDAAQSQLQAPRGAPSAQARPLQAATVQEDNARAPTNGPNPPPPGPQPPEPFHPMGPGGFQSSGTEAMTA